ncbi:hypothetical protein [Wohlfahrtiimonas larvae]|uniref:Uncharacterized protein n=1 Tax=Wohlfahrtiimonas larvae TaxID=1157986 RepID=A0ABP9MLL6_9GAMM|nr:hypothetical protein [Wohlfahrtiimonas larvae]
MSEVKSRPNIFLTALGWLFLVIVSFVISRPSLLFPISFIPVITILLCYSLYSEYSEFRRIALAIGALSFLFSAFTLISASYMDTLPNNLLNLEFNYGFMLILTTWLFVVVSGFITTIFILVKIIHRHSSAMLMLLINFIVFLAGFYFLRWFIPYMLQG